MRRGARASDTGDLRSGVSGASAWPVAAAAVRCGTRRRREAAAAPGSTTGTA